MKKILLSSIVLTLFSLSLFLMQISCQDEAIAQNGPSYVLPIATTSTLGGVIPDGVSIKVDGTGKISTQLVTLPKATTTTLGGIIVDGITLSVDENGKMSVISSKAVSQLSKVLIHDGTNFAVINNDGSQKVSIIFTLPAGQTLRSHPPKGRLSPDGNTLFFEAFESGSGTYFIYSVSIDGSNLTPIVSNTNVVDLMSAY